MKKLLFAILCCVGASVSAWAQSNPPLVVTEADGSPRVSGVTILRFDNGTVVCTGKDCRIQNGGGGGGSPGGSNTQVQYNAAGSFGGAAGFTFNGTSTINLGVAGTSVGAIGFRNATSGTITLQPVTGALGTVTLSLPAVTDTLVGLAATQTLTNKTITASSNVLGGVTMTLGSDADGDMYYRASNVLTRLPKGTAGQVLTMNGGATAPEWATVSGGGGITVGTTTVTSGTATRLFYETAGNVVGQVSGFTSDGTNVTAGSGNLRATLPQITTGLADANGNESILLTATGSAVNEITVANAATGNAPTISATGDDTNIGLTLSPKGTGIVGVSAAARTGTAAQVFRVLTPADTALTASTQSVLNQFGGDASLATVTRQFSTGALTTQRENVFVAPTYGFVGASTITNAATVSITGAPAAGTNATITNSYALRAEAGNIRFDSGIIYFSGLTSSNGGIREHTAITGAGGIAAFRGDSSVTSGSVVGSGFYTNQFTNQNTAMTISVDRTNGITLASNLELGWGSVTSGPANFAKDLILRRNAAAHLTFGAADAASPVAQTTSVQNVVGGTTNTAGTTWTLRGSLGTSQGAPGRIHLTGGAMIAVSGTTQQTAVDREIVGASKVLTNNSAITLVNVTNASDTNAGGVIDYCVEVTDSTDQQYECGMVTYGVSNKGGVWSGNTATKFGNHQNATSGTLTVTFAISGANPALLSVNANSSLSPSTGFPRITYSLRNLTQQAVAVQ